MALMAGDEHEELHVTVDQTEKTLREFKSRYEGAEITNDNTVTATLHALILAVEELRVRVRMLENARL